MKSTPKKIIQLEHSANLTRIFDRAQSLQALNQQIKAFISEPLSSNIMVTNYRNHTLYINASSAVWAARFNFTKKQLLAELTQILPKLQNIELTVNPKLSVQPNQPKPNTNRLSEKQAHHINEVAENIGGDLGDTLKRLAKLASRK